MPEFTLIFILYAMAVSTMQVVANIWLIKPYIKCKWEKKYPFAILFALLFGHDLFFGLFGNCNNYILLGVEMALFYPIISLVLWKFFKGSTYHNFIVLFAIDWCFQIFGMLISFPLYMVICNFDVAKVETFLDQPSFMTLFIMVILYFWDAWLTYAVWKVIRKHCGKMYYLLCLIFCALDILVLLIMGWTAVVIALPVIMGLIIFLFILQNKSEKQAQQQVAYYRALEETQRQKEKEISEIRHDIANHLKVMEEMNSDDEGQRILKKIDKKNTRIFSGVSVLDCLITEKESICLEKGIHFQKAGTILGEIAVTEYDLISLFANLLDNAIEAAEQTEEKEVSLSLEKQQGYLKIVLKNSKLQEMEPLKTQFKTTKRNKKNHGIGNRIIRDIVSNYDGRIHYEERGNELEAVILIAV